MGLKETFNVFGLIFPLDGADKPVCYLQTISGHERKARVAAQNASRVPRIVKMWVEDASGNVLATYVKGVEQTIALSGQGELK